MPHLWQCRSYLYKHNNGNAYKIYCSSHDSQHKDHITSCVHVPFSRSVLSAPRSDPVRPPQVSQIPVQRRRQVIYSTHPICTCTIYPLPPPLRSRWLDLVSFWYSSRLGRASTRLLAATNRHKQIQIIYKEVERLACKWVCVWTMNQRFWTNTGLSWSVNLCKIITTRKLLGGRRVIIRVDKLDDLYQESHKKNRFIAWQPHFVWVFPEKDSPPARKHTPAKT